MRSQNGSNCPVCGKPTHRDFDFGGKTYSVGVMCDCEVRDYEEAQARKSDNEKYQRRVRAFGSAELTRCRFDDDDGADANASRSCKAYAEEFEAAKEHGYGLLLFGRPDQGKTFLSACIANAVIDNGYSAVLRSVPDIVAKSGGFSDSWIDSMAACDLLILDDMGAERDTSYSREVLYRVIETRYSRKKPMVISTNLTIDAFRQPSSVDVERICNRVLERCLPVKVESGRSRAKKSTYDDIKRTIGIG